MTTPSAAIRVALYLRVSTGRQAEADLSIPDQERQIMAYCAQQGWTPVRTFTDAGLSGTDDRRPEFQRMIETAMSRDHPFDVIAVHSMSRFFRDQIESEIHIRRLSKAQVRVVSITQTFEDSPIGELIRKVVGSFDEYQSHENAKHTLRSMRENARQGYWNGSVPPFGYATKVAGQLGVRIKKRLVIREEEAAIVRYIYDLALGREGPALGIKAIVSRLNRERHQFRGKSFHIAGVHRILTSSTYAGTHVFNRRQARDGAVKPREEWETAAVPAIICATDFEAVKLHLTSRQPRTTPPRQTGSPTLLTGLARCGTCECGMTLRTGKSGRYRYYVCAGRAQKGDTWCPGRSIAMDTLDGMVLEHLVDRLFTADRLRQILAAYLDRDASTAAARRQTLGRLRQQKTEITGAIDRLLDLVAQGVMTADDTNLRTKLTGLRTRQDGVASEISLLEAAAKAPDRAITPERIDRFASALRQALTHGDVAFRKAYLRLFVDRIVVEADAVHITGTAAAIAHAAVAHDASASHAVPSFVPKWRGERNPRPTFAGDGYTAISMAWYNVDPHGYPPRSRTPG